MFKFVHMVSGHTLHRLLAIYFYEHKQLSIPHMGQFKLVGELPIPSHHHLAELLPEGSVEFQVNWNQQADPELLEFITSQTHKMKALALADLESLSHQAQEMINIGQPYSFEGIGTLSKDAHGTWELSPGRLIPELNRKEPGIPAQLYETPAELQAASDSQSPSRQNWLRIGPFAILAAVLLAGATYLWMRGHHSSPSSPLTSTSHVSSHVASIPHTDSSVSPDQLRLSTPSTDTLHYEVVFETAHFARAFRRYKQLSAWGAHVVLTTRDSVNFTLATPFATPAADSLHMKDSIAALYGRQVYIRLH